MALPSAADARQCAAAGIYGAQHYEGQTPGTTVPYRMFSAVTVDINPPTGEFETYIAEADLRQLLSQIAH